MGPILVYRSKVGDVSLGSGGAVRSMAEEQNTGDEGPHDSWLEKLFKRHLAKTTNGEREEVMRRQRMFRDKTDLRARR